MGSDGITRLIQATQLKSANANEEAVNAADKQRSNVEKQKSVHQVNRTLDSLVPGADFAATKHAGKVNTGATSEASLSTPAAYLGRFSKSGFVTSSPFSPHKLTKNLDFVASDATRYASGINDFIKALKKRFEDPGKNLEAQDKISNFELQTLLSNYNESATLASSLKKKTDDQNSCVISKIG